MHVYLCQFKIWKKWFTDIVPFSIEYVLIHKANKKSCLFFQAKPGIPGQFGVKTATALKPSTYHTLGHLSLASLLDLSTLSSFQLILAHFEPIRDHTCTVSYTPNTKTSPHYSCRTTYIRPATTCNDVQNIWYVRIQHDGIHTWYNNTEVLVVRESTITKAMQAKNAGLVEQFIPLMHTNVLPTSPTKKSSESKRGESRLPSVLLYVAWIAWLPHFV